MDVETTLANGLHITDDSAGYDAACKRVLSEKAILARIMKACLEEYKDCDVNCSDTLREVLKYINRIQSQRGEGTQVLCGYEAGCLGYSLYH